MRTAALLGAGGDTEDVVQEAFVKAYAALTARERRSWAQVQPLLLTPPDDPAEAALTQERQQAIVRGLAGLSRPQREVVTCRYLLDLDEAETAAVLGWPRGTVKSRLHRALRRLRELLETEAAHGRAEEVAHDG
jgi:RNA polymerase sigma-70 factor (ECF subfamily)